MRRGASILLFCALAAPLPDPALARNWFWWLDVGRVRGELRAPDDGGQAGDGARAGARSARHEGGGTLAGRSREAVGPRDAGDRPWWWPRHWAGAGEGDADDEGHWGDADDEGPEDAHDDDRRDDDDAEGDDGQHDQDHDDAVDDEDGDDEGDDGPGFDPPIVVPLPPGLVLMASAVGLLAVAGRHRSADRHRKDPADRGQPAP